MHDALCATDVTAHYRRSQALFGISISLPPKGTVAILGRNGAGKTTLLKTLAGDLPASHGRIELFGEDITAMPPDQRSRKGLGYVPQDGNIFSNLTVRENLEIGAMASPNSRADLDSVVQLFPRLGERLNQQAGTLSGGERKMVAIGRAMIAQPEIILLDEPTEGVWQGVIEEIARRLEELAKHTAIVIVEQHVELALRIARYCYVIDRGRVALEGETQSIRGSAELERLLAP